ncbi:MAG TPA: universal stress protein [Xanthobacteraceae bacterium]|jgi:nucleotide-binding universal stress UspA family protein
MKTILIPAEDHQWMSAVLETARLIASRFDSYMEGFAVRPSAADFVAVEPVSSLAIASVEEADAEIAREARTSFERFMQAHDVPRAAPRGPATYSFGWIRNEAEDDAFVGSYGRLFDLTVLGRPGRSAQHPRVPPLEAALFESGRPVLIAPRIAPPVVGKNVLIAWNGSTEQARTTAFALPLLREATRVTVLSVEGGMTPGPTGEQVAHFLGRHGIEAAATTISPGTKSTGETILDHAKALGCDLLVKGAYTQSRLRQIIFGGATRHILANAELPVWMAH